MSNGKRQISSWQLQDAKARFSDFLNAALEKGPQVVTRRGVEAAVLVPIEQWRRMQSTRRPGIKELLLSGPRFGNLVSARRSWSDGFRWSLSDTISAGDNIISATVDVINPFKAV